MNIAATLAQELNLRADHVENVITLLDEGNTVPFIARYRKEMHGTMDDQVIRQLADRLAYLRGLEKRKEEVLHAIEEQEKLGKLFVIRPPHKLQIGKVEKNPNKLKEIYDIGRETVAPQISAIKEFLKA